MKTYVANYFDTEYNLLANLLKSKPAWLNVNEAIQNSLQRCLGVAEFTQVCGDDSLPFAVVSELYEEVKEKIENLRFSY
jgi:hypothetical protein